MKPIISVPLALSIILGGTAYYFVQVTHTNNNDKDVEIVVAHYDEDLSWISDKRNNGNNERYTIYSKNSIPLDGATHIPNVGRESQTFLYHIVERYDSLADWTVFTQASAPTFGFKANNHNSGHMCSGVTWEDYMKPNTDGWYEVQTVATRYPEMWHSDRFDMMFKVPTSKGLVCPPTASSWSMWWTEEDHPLLKKQKTDEHFVEPVEFYNRYVVADASDKTFTNFTLNYANGGRYAVSRERIHMRPISYYKDLLEQLSKDLNPIEGYYMETMWYDVFHPERLQAEYGTVCTVPAFPVSVVEGGDVGTGVTSHSIMFEESLSLYDAYLVETYGSIEAAPRNLEVSGNYVLEENVVEEEECLDSPIGWHDNDGPDYNCSWYASSVNCRLYGGYFGNQGKTANQACCVCGGGTVTSSSRTTDNTPEPTTPLPTEPTETSDSNCANYPPNWHDSDGTHFDCEWYAQEDRCNLFGDFFGNPDFGNRTANQVCCVCGGGNILVV